jgi:hypothetical protein
VPAWRRLPPAPIVGRVWESVAWTGEEMVVAGGMARGVSLADAAAYDPEGHSWRRIAPPPDHLSGGATVWTGDAVLAWTGNGLDGPVVSASYDPADDRWTRLPDGPLGPREGYASAWTGKELVIVGGHRGEAEGLPVAAALDPADGTWRVLHGLDGVHFYGGPSGAVWNGRDVILAGNVSLCPEKGVACDRFSATLVAYDPTTDTARDVPLPAPSADFGADTAAQLKPVAWTGTDVVFTAGVQGTIELILWNPTIGSWAGQEGKPCHIVAAPAQGHGCRDWRSTQVAPCYVVETQTAWLGDRFVASCSTDGLQIFDLATGTWDWRTIVPGRSAFTTREGSAVVWTGHELIAWSGTVRGVPGGPTPGDGASLVLPPP